MTFLNRAICLLFINCFFIMVIICAGQNNSYIRPGEIWPDNKGDHIQAHGGGIMKFGKKYYWYGEQRATEYSADSNYKYVSCYVSDDLLNWKFKGNALKLAKPDSLIVSGYVLERPKVYYNERTRKFVMYMHLDGKVNGVPNAYGYARVGVAVSDKPEGPFTYVRSFRPLGKESRDIGQFIDDDGKAYLIFESRPTKGFFIAELSDDYLNAEKETAFILSPLEGGAIVHVDNKYYVIGSRMTGWKPNPNKVAVAESLSGPWRGFTDIAPPETNTYQSQSTFLLKVKGKKKTSILYMGDQWRPNDLKDSRYLWTPVEIMSDSFRLQPPQPFKINVKTGELTYENKK